MSDFVGHPGDAGVFDVPQGLRRAMGDVVGANFELELAISNANEPVSVAPPSNQPPASELPSG